MSVLIKGMKMPRYCAECDAVIDEELLCPFTNDDCENYFRVRNRNCPLSPVPPHGRLIDADKQDAQIETLIERHLHGYTKSTWDFVCELRDILKRNSTIIPAEEGEA